jgi:hypothetical protein
MATSRAIKFDKKCKHLSNFFAVTLRALCWYPIILSYHLCLQAVSFLQLPYMTRLLDMNIATYLVKSTTYAAPHYAVLFTASHHFAPPTSKYTCTKVRTYMRAYKHTQNFRCIYKKKLHTVQFSNSSWLYFHAQKLNIILQTTATMRFPGSCCMYKCYN